MASGGSQSGQGVPGATGLSLLWLALRGWWLLGSRAAQVHGPVQWISPVDPGGSDWTHRQSPTW